MLIIDKFDITLFSGGGGGIPMKLFVTPHQLILCLGRTKLK